MADDQPAVPVKVETDCVDHLSSKTTAEEDKHSASQRRVNLIWEYTQAAIALQVVVASLTGAFYFGRETVPPLLTNAFFLIVGFYFGRTNHQRVGGVQGGR